MSSNPLCDTSEQCRSSVVSCVEGEDCFVDCIAYRACYNATIECPSNSHNCRIYCADHDACKYATINSSSSNGNLTLVGGSSDWQFSLTKIHCPNGGSCSVNCASTDAVYGSCNEMTVYGQNAKRVYIDTGNGGPYGLQWTKIYCPHTSNGTECTIVVQNMPFVYQMKGMQIYAIDSLNDVSVTCKPTTTTYCYPADDPPIMHYTLDYSRACTMDLVGQDQWNCFDPRTTYPTLEPTALPSVAPSGVSLHPSAAPSSSPTQAPSTAPTGPSAQPTTRTPTEPTNTPTKTPTYATPVITNCTNETERVCYYVDIHPIPGVVQSRLISIQDIDHGAIDTYYDIYVTPTINHCVDASVTLTYEQIDYDGGGTFEGLGVIRPSGTTITTCSSTNDCGSFASCVTNQTLGVTKLIADESNLLVTLKVSYGVDDLCGRAPSYHNYAINARLTIFCSDAPTTAPMTALSTAPTQPSISPTKNPTRTPTKPTNTPTKAPTYGSPMITDCNDGTERVCYYVDIHPLLTTLISIQDIDHGYIDTYYDIYVTPTSNHCVYPSITLTYEANDYYYDKVRIPFQNGLHVLNPNGNTIKTCYITNIPRYCGYFKSCVTNQNLGITKLAADESNLLVTLEVDRGVAAVCDAHAINAQLTIFCSDSTAPPTNDPTAEPTLATLDPTDYPTHDPTLEPTVDPTIEPTLATLDPTDYPIHEPTLEPTLEPTVDPTIDPTLDPTKDPTIDPTLDPTADPTNDPTYDPTHDPTLDPTSYPSTDPTHDPTNDPTVEPTFGPTKRPTPAPIACSYNTFSFSDSLSCFYCDDSADGYECKGQNILTVQRGFWVSAVPKPQAFDEFISLDDKRFDAINYSLVSLRCPPGQCCDANGGCSYYDLDSANAHVRRSNALCAKGRNISSITCSECNEGLYPLIGTRICDRCDHTKYPLLCIPLVLSVIFVIFMVFVFSKPVKPLFVEQEIDWRQLFMRDESAIIKILVLKITLYFYQSLSQILFTKNITPATQLERTLLSISSFEIFSSSSGGSGFCVIGQIESGLHQLLISQIFYGFLIVDLLIILLMNRISNVSLYSFCCCFACCLRKSRLQSYQPFVKTGAINILMMCAGPILSLCFKLLTPINIGDDHHPQYYHFYDATKPCYRLIWFASFICISLIFIVMLILWHSVRQQSSEQRGNVSNEYRSLINKYTSRAWYWEFVLFARRFIIAIFTAIETNAMTSVVLGLCIMILLVAHTHFKPFRYDRANVVETLCLLSLGSILLCLNIPVTGIYVKAMSIYVSVLILTPIVVILLLCVRILYRLCKFRITNNADISFSKEMVAIEKIITRMPTKHRTSFKEDIQIQLQQTTHKKDTTKSKPDVEGEGDSYTLTHDHVLAAFDIEKKTSIEILPPEDSYQNESVSSIEVKYS